VGAGAAAAGTAGVGGAAASTAVAAVLAHPFVFITAPIIAGILTYEYVKLPEKLASKVAPQVAEAFVAQAGPLHAQVASTFTTEGIKAVQSLVEQEFQRLRNKLTDEVTLSSLSGKEGMGLLSSPLLDKLV
jgi:hypothetical protein